MRRQTVLKIAIGSLLVFGGLHLFGSTSIKPLYTISSEISLPASPRESWRVLTDFASYPDWNPYLRRVDGRLAPGEAVSYTLVDGNFSGPFDGVAQIIKVSESEQFYWIGKAGIQGIFDTRHVFKLEPQEDGSTLLLHFEEFRGLLAALLPKREERSAHTLRAFREMNLALQQRLAGEH